MARHVLEPYPEIHGCRQDGERARDPDAHGHEGTELASRNKSCAMRLSSVMTHGKIAIGKPERMNTTAFPVVGALR
jgi:hypothetical protein